MKDGRIPCSFSGFPLDYNDGVQPKRRGVGEYVWKKEEGRKLRQPREWCEIIKNQVPFASVKNIIQLYMVDSAQSYSTQISLFIVKFTRNDKMSSSIRIFYNVHGCLMSINGSHWMFAPCLFLSAWCIHHGANGLVCFMRQLRPDFALWASAKIGIIWTYKYVLFKWQTIKLVSMFESLARNRQHLAGHSDG